MIKGIFTAIKLQTNFAWTWNRTSLKWLTGALIIHLPNVWNWSLCLVIIIYMTCCNCSIFFQIYKFLFSTNLFIFLQNYFFFLQIFYKSTNFFFTCEMYYKNIFYNSISEVGVQKDAIFYKFINIWLASTLWSSL